MKRFDSLRTVSATTPEAANHVAVVEGAALTSSCGGEAPNLKQSQLVERGTVRNTGADAVG
jgi:hypothetical protein